MEVSVTRFRRELARWLDAVGRGREVVVTDRGRPVARIVPAKTPPALDRLIAEGTVTPPKRSKRPTSSQKPVKSTGSVVELLLEQRRR